MDIHEALQTAGQYIYIGFRALLEGLQKLFGMLADWFQSLPWPNAIKLFSNDTANKYLMKVCFFGGATGGIIGMNVFRHKTLKKKFSVGIPILFVLQLILNSFILGFLGFWTFF